MQIPEIPAQRKFVSEMCTPTQTPTNRPKLWLLHAFDARIKILTIKDREMGSQIP